MSVNDNCGFSVGARLLSPGGSLFQAVSDDGVVAALSDADQQSATA